MLSCYRADQKQAKIKNVYIICFLVVMHVPTSLSITFFHTFCHKPATPIGQEYILKLYVALHSKNKENCEYNLLSTLFVLWFKRNDTNNDTLKMRKIIKYCRIIFKVICHKIVSKLS